MKSALIVGGTGIISLSVTKLLLEKGWSVTVLNRGNRPLPEGCELMKADAADEASISAQMGRRFFDVVADYRSFTVQDVERSYRMFTGRCGQYIFISSASVYQKPLSSYLITESTPLANPYWEYSRNKIACEEALMRHCREDGFPLTIVRPSHTYDETSLPMCLHGDGGYWQVLLRMMQGRPVIVPGDGSSLWTVTHSSDFAKGFVGLMGNVHAIGEAVQITSDESLTWNQIHVLVADALGVPYKPLHVSTDFIAATGEKAGLSFTDGLLGDKSNTVVFDNTKLKRLVPGFVAAVRFDEGVRRSVNYIKNTPALQKEDPAFDAWCERMVNCVQSALEIF